MSQEPNIVEPCKGWTSPCSFCDKRFSKWKELDEETFANEELAKPGLFMFALESKLGKEVVVIGSHETDVRLGLQQKLPTVKQQTSQKKHKESKSNILLRYLNVQSEDSKEACVLFSHWFNYGILPRLIPKWPGLVTLKNTQHYQFSELCNKWCHPTKDPFWKKQKSNLAPRAVKPCKGWRDTSCSFCNSRFTTWVPYLQALEMVTSEPGILMFSTLRNRIREISYLDASFSMKSSLHHGHSSLFDISKREEGSVIEVRWMTLEDIESEDACFVYAHFINNKIVPRGHSDSRLTQYPVPSEEILRKSESFSFRSRDKQWCYEGDLSRRPAASYSKTKDKRNVRESIEDEILMKN